MLNSRGTCYGLTGYCIYRAVVITLSASLVNVALNVGVGLEAGALLAVTGVLTLLLSAKS